MKITIDDGLTMFFVTLLLEVEKEIGEVKIQKVKTYDIYQTMAKEAKNVPEAIDFAIKQARETKKFTRVVTQNAAIMTPKMFLLNK